jgi:RND family efflux transporter MFP subunit
MVFLAKFKDVKTNKVEVVSAKYVSAIPVVYKASNTSFLSYGKVISAQSINLVAEASGKLMPGKVSLKKAIHFSKNDLLFQIDNSDARLTLIAQKSDFMNLISASMAEIKYDYPDSFQSWENYLQQLDVNKSLTILPETKSKKEKAFISNKKILSAYYSIKSAEEKLSKFSFYAPYNGSIADLKVEIGTVVAAGTNIGRIIRTDEMEVEIPVKAEMISWVQKGMSVILSSQDKKSQWNGTVQRISDFIDVNTQSVLVFVKIIPNTSSQLLEGMYLTADFKTKILQEVMELPRKSLVGNDKVYVFQNGKLVLKTILLHKLTNDTFFFSGLEKDELVVNENLINVVEGAEVKLK